MEIDGLCPPPSEPDGLWLAGGPLLTNQGPVRKEINNKKKRGALGRELADAAPFLAAASASLRRRRRRLFDYKINK